MELDAVHRHRHQEWGRSPGPDNLAPGTNCRGLIEITQDDTAKNGAVWIGIPRHHDGLNGQIRLGHQIPTPSAHGAPGARLAPCWPPCAMRLTPRFGKSRNPPSRAALP